MYYTCDVNVMSRGTSGCYFCDKSLYTFLNENKGKYSLISADTNKSIKSIPKDLCAKVFLYFEDIIENKDDIEIIDNIVFNKYTGECFGYLVSYNQISNNYIIDQSIGSAYIEYENILLLQRIFGKKYSEYILHPKKNILLLLEIKEDAPHLYEYNDKNTDFITRRRVPIILSKGCNTIENVSRNNLNKFINDIMPVIKILHTKGYIHADIKYQNIVKCENRYKIIDWGSMQNIKSVDDPIGTYIIPFFAINKLYMKNHIPSMNISTVAEIMNISDIFNKVESTMVFVDDKDKDNQFAFLSYKLFMAAYANRHIDINFILKKNDEYCLAYIIYKNLIKYMDSIDLINKLNSKTNNKLLRKMYYLLSPDYLSLERI